MDTGVFSARLGRRKDRLAEEYKPVLEGRPAMISFITVAELRYVAKAGASDALIYQHARDARDRAIADAIDKAAQRARQRNRTGM